MRVETTAGTVLALVLSNAAVARAQTREPPADPEPDTRADGARPSPAAEFYADRMRDLQQRIGQLRADVTRARIELDWMGERVLGLTIGGARVLISHQNAMGPLFRPVRVTYTLDGAPLMSRADDAGLGDRANFVVFDGALGPGEHTVVVTTEYVGYGLGVFPYAGGYRYRVQSTQSFTVPEGRALELRVVGYEQGGAITAHGERPALRFQQRLTTLRDLEAR